MNTYVYRVNIKTLYCLHIQFQSLHVWMVVANNELQRLVADGCRRRGTCCKDREFKRPEVRTYVPLYLPPSIPDWRFRAS